MKYAFFHFLQLAAAVSLFIIFPSPFGILQENPLGFLKLYQETAELFAIPFCLLFFSFSKRHLFIALRLGWGMWTALVSTGLLWKASIQFPEITEFGLLLVAFNGVLGFSLGLFSLIDLSRTFPEETPSMIASLPLKEQTPEPPRRAIEGN